MERIYSDFINKITDDMLAASVKTRQRFVDSLIQLCKKRHERYVVAMLYIYGMRPKELMMLKKRDFTITDKSVTVRLPTVKKGEERTIRLKIADTPFLNIVVNHVERSESLLPMSWKHTTNINAVFKRISKLGGERRFSPYIFRKYRLSYLAIEQDASAYDLKLWKGAKDMRSVSPYLRMKPLTKFESKIK
jgi:integrase